MGYTTEFEGNFKINKPLDKETFKLINGIATTRRMKRKGLNEKYGIDGEFYFNPNSNNFGQERDDETIVNYNEPPSTQPSLWCQWIVLNDMQTIEWDGGEKFYNYIEWIEYIINRILKPRNYILNGVVYWYGEDRLDTGKIMVKNNEVKIF